MKTRSQIFAEKAIQVVYRWDAGNYDKQKLRTAALSFPALIQTCGLLQALAFVEEKKESQPYAEGFKQELGVHQDVGAVTVDSLAALGAVEYMRVSRMAIEAATWIKRYAASVLPEPDQPA